MLALVLSSLQERSSILPQGAQCQQSAGEGKQLVSYKLEELGFDSGSDQQLQGTWTDIWTSRFAQTRARRIQQMRRGSTAS